MPLLPFLLDCGTCLSQVSCLPTRSFVFSLVQRLLLPLFRVKSDESIVWLHLDPTHFIRHVDPAFRLEEFGGTELGSVVWHVVEHVEEDGVWEGFDGSLG